MTIQVHPALRIWLLSMWSELFGVPTAEVGGILLPGDHSGAQPKRTIRLLPDDLRPLQVRAASVKLNSTAGGRIALKIVVLQQVHAQQLNGKHHTSFKYSKSCSPCFCLQLLWRQVVVQGRHRRRQDGQWCAGRAVESAAASRCRHWRSSLAM